MTEELGDVAVNIDGANQSQPQAPSVTAWKNFWLTLGNRLCGPMKGYRDDPKFSISNLTKCNIAFWIIYSCCILIEPILVGSKPKGANFILQIIFLVLNTLLYLVVMYSHAEQDPAKMKRMFKTEPCKL